VRLGLKAPDAPNVCVLGALSRAVAAVASAREGVLLKEAVAPEKVFSLKEAVAPGPRACVVYEALSY
jgi:hypothetical protein